MLAGGRQPQTAGAEAEPFYRQSVAIREKALGPEHPRVATGLDNLAGLYEAQGKYAVASPQASLPVTVEPETDRTQGTP
ncbi:MAG: tetratricopeptide repeat protein [Proteobacteria bacterium]|nr:tetratricopeptide repeat protein [Pseudomonadota bacterium]